MTSEEAIGQRVAELLSDLPVTRQAVDDGSVEYSIRFDADIAVQLVIGQAHDCLCLSRRLGPLPAVSEAFLAEAVLRYNYLWPSNHGMHLQLDAQQCLELRLWLPAEGFSPNDFRILLVNFAQAGENWRALLQPQPTRGAAETEAGPAPEQNEPPDTIRSMMDGIKV